MISSKCQEWEKCQTKILYLASNTLQEKEKKKKKGKTDICSEIETKNLTPKTLKGLLQVERKKDPTHSLDTAPKSK